jgi:Glycosyltransferase family 87
MAAIRSSFRLYRLLVFLATAWTIASWIFLLDTNVFSQREMFQESDFIMTFYVAGHLAANGRSNELYPSPDARSFIDSPFDKAAHALLPKLPTHTTGAYMYIPLVAGFFAPFSLLDPNLAMLVWQILSVLSLGACTLVLSRITGANSSEMFFLSFLFAPVFLTLWAGQLGLGFGLLPLCFGYFLILREKPLAAGLVWSLLLLKPQFFISAAFVAIVCACMRRFRILIGMTIGVVGFIVLTMVLFSIPVTLQWLLSHRVSDAYFFSGLQVIPSHLLTGLPANLMVLFPVHERDAVKLPLYAAAALFWLFGLWFCLRFRKLPVSISTQISVAFTVGLFLASVTLPHLLYYDLCLLLPAGVLLLAKNGPLSRFRGLRSVAVSGWLIVSGFLPLLLVFTKQKVLPLLLEILLVFLFAKMLWQVSLSMKSPEQS